jgi:hypothetical protein
MPVICSNQIDRFLIAAIFALVPVTTIAADSRDPATPAPYGWTVYSTGPPGGAALRCANFSRREWSVSLEGDTPLISVHASRKTMTAIAFENGRLAGYDNGEFGGGLWWIDADRLGNEDLTRQCTRSFTYKFWNPRARRSRSLVNAVR